MISSLLVGGLVLGVVYALVALGYSLVYGILKFINFAHGDIYMIGAFTGLFIAHNFSASPFILIPLVAIITGLLGFIIEKIAYKPLRYAPRLNSMITAIAVGIILQGVIIKIAGPQTRGFPNIIEEKKFIFSFIEITNIQIYLFLIVAVLFVGLFWLTLKTNFGIAMRASSENVDQLNLLGINSNRIISWTFIIGSALGGIAGVLFGTYFEAIFPYMGASGGIKAFVAAIIGGIGSIPGAVAGGIIMGLSEVIFAHWLPSYRDAVAFLLLIIILIYKPTGIFGTKEEERV